MSERESERERERESLFTLTLAYKEPWPLLVHCPATVYCTMHEQTFLSPRLTDTCVFELSTKVEVVV